jgi:hypothetical protein
MHVIHLLTLELILSRIPEYWFSKHTAAHTLTPVNTHAHIVFLYIIIFRFKTILIDLEINKININASRLINLSIN